jgi:hypothetical protein
MKASDREKGAVKRIKWGAPPPPAKSIKDTKPRSAYDPLIDRVRQRQGEWGKIATGIKRQVVSSYLQKRYKDIEFVWRARGANGQGDVWARVAETTVTEAEVAE